MSKQCTAALNCYVVWALITRKASDHSTQAIHGIPNSRKYWRSLNLAVWLLTERKKCWRNLNLAVAPRSVLRHYKHCERELAEDRVYQAALPSSRLR